MPTPTKPPWLPCWKAKLKHTETTTTRPPAIKSCNSKTCKTSENLWNFPFIEDGLSSCTFKSIGPTHRIKQTITFASKNFIYMHDTVLKTPKHSLLTSRIYRTDETRITRQIWRTRKSYIYNTTADDAVPQHFNRYDALSQRSIRTVTIRKDR